MMSGVSPFPHGLGIKDDSMREWSKKHENYIQLQVTVGESGEGVPGSCSLHSVLTNLFLSKLNSPRAEARRRTDPKAPDTAASPLVILNGPGAGSQGLRGERAGDCRMLLSLTARSHPGPPCPTSGKRPVGLRTQSKEMDDASHEPLLPPVCDAALRPDLTVPRARVRIPGRQLALSFGFRHFPLPPRGHPLRTCSPPRSSPQRSRVGSSVYPFSLSP